MNINKFDVTEHCNIYIALQYNCKTKHSILFDMTLCGGGNEPHDRITVSVKSPNL